MFRHLSLGIIAAGLAACSLAACGPTGGIASANTVPASTAAAIADASLPPPSEISPTSKTTVDDSAIRLAWDALDVAAYAADALLVAKPSITGTPAARDLANALEGASTWLKVASQAQRASQASSYAAALQQASAAIAGAHTALGKLKVAR